MGYAIRIGDAQFVKRTAQFGNFHGRLVLTSEPREARIWTRKGDAIYKAQTVQYRIHNYRNTSRTESKIPLDTKIQIIPEEELLSLRA